MGQRGNSSISYRSLNAGEFSGFMESRSDLEKYQFASKQLQNMLITPYGPITRRTGTRYVQETKYSDRIARMIEFEFSVTTTFALEIGHEYIRFFKDGGPVETSPGVPYEISTPYQEGDLYDLDWDGVNDITYFTHPDYPVYKLVRLADDNWTFTAVDYGVKAAFLDQNSSDTTLTLSAVTGSGVTMTASSALFDPLHVGSLFQVGHERESDNLILPLAFPVWSGLTEFEVGDGIVESGTKYRCMVPHTSSVSFATDSSNWSADYDVSDPLRVQGDWNFLTTGFFRADIKVQESKDGLTGWKTIGKYTRKEDGNINASGTQAVDSFLRIKVENWTTNKTESGRDADNAKEYARANLEVSNAFLYGIAEVTAYTSPTVVTVTMVQDAIFTTATDLWSESAWSEFQGYPRAVAFHEERIILGGTRLKPQRIWFSQSEQYEIFTSGPDATSSFSKELGSQRYQVQWMISQDTLIIGAKGGEFVVTSGAERLVLTPKNSSARRQSEYGSKHAKGISVNDVALFLTRDGKKLREFVSVIDPDGAVGYKAPDLTLLSEHIAGPVDGGFSNIVFQQQKNPTVWAATADGDLASMAYNREQNVTGWSRHVTRGNVESVCVVTGENRDEVWVTVKRDIDGVTKRFVEYMEPDDWIDATDETYRGISDAFFVDCGITYEGVAATSVSVPHLIGEEVQILGDGRLIAGDGNTRTVPPSGVVDLSDIDDTGFTKIQVGLQFDSIWQPMRLDVDNQSGDLIGQEKCIYELSLRVKDSVGFQHSDELGHFSDGEFVADYESFLSTNDLLDRAIPPFTGDRPVSFDGDYGTETTVIIKQSQPLPLTIVSCVMKYKVTGNK